MANKIVQRQYRYLNKVANLKNGNQKTGMTETVVMLICNAGSKNYGAALLLQRPDKFEYTYDNDGYSAQMFKSHKGF